MAFCTDDTHPDDLIKGHINILVKRAMATGLDPIKVLRMASLNPIQQYDLDVGLLQENDAADFLIVDKLDNLEIQKTVIDGKIVFEKNKPHIKYKRTKEINKFEATKKQIPDFSVPARNSKINIIEARDGELITNRLQEKPKIENNQSVSDAKRDILKIALVNRYRNQKPAVAFVKNFSFKKGAIASSVAHDSHNILTVGVSDRDLCQAVNLIIKNKGGLSLVCEDDNIAEILPLPIAGLMSNDNYQKVAKKYNALNQLARSLGTEMNAPFMTLSFMALLVIPEIKIGNMGLFDVKKFEFIE